MNRKHRISSFLVALSLSGATAGGAVRFVKQDAAGNGSGSSWGNAHPGLSAALEAAAKADEIWVAAGVYLPTTEMLGGDGLGAERRRSFLFTTGVSVYGGFVGSETVRSERDWVANPTVLSGNLGDPDSPSDNSLSTLTVLFVNPWDFRDPRGSVAIDGFTISDGNANITSAPAHSGGGLEYQGGGAFKSSAAGIFFKMLNTSAALSASTPSPIPARR